MGFSQDAFDSKVTELCEWMWRYAFNTGVLRWRDEIKESLADWYDWISLDDGTTVREYTLVAPSRHYTIPVVLDRETEDKMWADFEAGVTRIGDRAHVWVSDEVSYSLHKLDDITGMRPEEYANAARALHTVGSGLFDKTPNTLTFLSELGSDWQGRAARNYRENFFKIVPPSIGNHAWLIKALSDAIQAAKAVTDIGQLSAMNLVEKGCETVKLALDAQADENTIDPQEVLIGLNAVVGIVNDIVPFIPPGVSETADAISKWLASHSASTDFLGLAAAKAETLDKQHLRGPDPDALFASIDESVEEILAGNWKGWDHVETEHTYRAYQTLGAREATMFPFVPDIAEGDVPPGDFHHSSSDQYE
jgi:hypothetical protein